MSLAQGNNIPTRLRIEPGSPDPESDALTTRPVRPPSVVNSHSNDLPYKFAVNVDECQDRLPTMYWLPKLHKRPYKARFIANSSSCTTTELSKLITSCLTATKAYTVLLPNLLYTELLIISDCLTPLLSLPGFDPVSMNCFMGNILNYYPTYYMQSY